MTSIASARAFLFDLDGTLVDTVGTRVSAWLDVFRDEGVDADPTFVGTLMGSDGKLVAQKIAAAAGLTLDPAAAAAIDDRAGARFGELNHTPRALPGVGAIVALVEAASLPWAIATSSRPNEVQASVDALGLAGRPMVTDGSHVEQAKPAPDLLLSAARQLGIDPDGVWYVGDSKWDMLAAVAAGMIAIGVATGATAADELRDAGAVAVFADLRDLERYLRERPALLGD